MLNLLARALATGGETVILKAFENNGFENNGFENNGFENNGFASTPARE